MGGIPLGRIDLDGRHKKRVHIASGVPLCEMLLGGGDSEGHSGQKSLNEESRDEHGRCLGLGGLWQELVGSKVNLSLRKDAT